MEDGSNMFELPWSNYPQSENNALPHREGMSRQLDQQEPVYISNKQKGSTDNARNKRINM